MKGERPLRICMLTTFFPPFSFGGDAIYVQRLANALVKRGHHVEVVHCADSFRLLAGRRPLSTTTEVDPRVTVHTLRSRAGPLSPLLTHQTGRPLLKTARLNRVLASGFDVINYHNVSLIGGPGILALGSAIKLYTMHECWLVCPTHVLFRMKRQPCNKPTCLSCTLVHRRPPQLWRYGNLLRRSLQHVDAFIALSRFCAEAHRERGLELPVTHLPSFAPRPEHGSSGGSGQRRRRGYFLFVGRLDRIKGLHEVIPILQREPRARLVVAGAGTEDQRLRHLAAGDPRVSFVGHVGGSSLAELYQGALAVIVPSLVPEILPLVILEAFSHGAPVVVRDRGGMPEVVDESGGGIVFRNDEDLLTALRRLLDRPEMAADMGARGRDTWRRLWTPEAHVESYLELIDRLLHARGESLRDACFE